MRGTRRLLLGVLAGIWVLPMAANAQRSDFRGFPIQNELDRYNLDRRWYTQVPVLKLREYPTSMKIDEGLLFVQTNHGLIHCLDAETGEILWSSVVGHRSEEVFPPALSSEHVYVVVGNQLHQLDRKTGRRLWTEQLPTGGSAGPAANEDFVYVPTVDHRLYAFTLRNEYELKYTKRPIAWFYDAGSNIDSPPALSESRVAVLARDGIVYCLALDSLKLFYRYYTHSPVSAPLVTFGRNLYVATRNFEVFAIDLGTGVTKWRFLSSHPISAKPVVFRQDLFVTPEKGGLFCIDNQTGRSRWTNAELTRLIAVSQEYVYGADRFSNFVIVSRQEGHEIASWPIPAFSISTENQFNDRIYMSTPRGLIVCLHEKGNQQPFLHPQAELDVGEPARPSIKRPPGMRPPKNRPLPPIFFGAPRDKESDEKKVDSKTTKPQPPPTKKDSFFDDF